MKRFKFALLIILVFAMLATLTSCIVIPRHKYYDDIDTQAVASVDIYDLRERAAQGSDFLKTETPVYTLTADQHKDFFSQLEKIRFTDHIVITIAAMDPSFSYGDWVVKINFFDGTVLLISCSGYGETIDKNGQVIDSNHYGCDDEEWTEFVGKYLPKELLD